MGIAIHLSPVSDVLAGLGGLDAVACGWVARRRPAAAWLSVTVLLAAAAAWCLAYSVELATTGRTSREVWGDLQYLGSTVLPPAWLLFALEYTGRRRAITGRLLAALSVDPIAVLILFVVPATHHLLRSFPPGPVPRVPVIRLGPAYWVHLVYGASLTAAGTALLVVGLLRASSVYYRKQTLTLAAAVLLPVVGEVASSLALPGARAYDPTPIAVSFGGMVLVWGAFRYRLLDLTPVARNLAFDRLRDPILVLDAYGRVVDRNPAAAELLGAGAAIGASLHSLVQDQVALLDATPVGAEIRIERGHDTCEYELVASSLDDDRGRRAGQILHLRDITARKRAERSLRWLAEYDPLTALPNRRLLAERLDQVIARARRAQGRCALILLDVDRFKMINDSLGHQAGDQVLSAVGARLGTGRRVEDTAARLGGDEFALLLPEIARAADAELVAGRVLAAIAEPLPLAGRELIVTASAGVAVWPDDGGDAQQLFRCADTAMYRAKAHGRNRTERGIFTPEESAADRLELSVDLRHALLHGELRVAFQPLVKLEGGALIGMEALVRWEHPRLGSLAPAAFLPVAEETGLSTEIDQWVLATACSHAWRWSQAGRPVPVTVNVSAERFRDAPLTLSTDVQGILRRTELDAHLLILEINERTIIDDPEPVAQELRRVRELGVGLALDDFGAGHTSLTHLRRLPIGMLKIDHDLVQGIGTDTDDTRILSAVTTLAHILRMTVVAEGVERADQVAALGRAGCDAAQGFFFCPPVDAAAADALVAESDRAPTLSPIRTG